MDEQESLPPHVLIFPLPLQGPVNSMFKLAELLCFSGLHITILLTENIHNRLVLHTDISSRFNQCPGFQIKTISDGLPDDHPRDGGKFLEVFDSLRTKTKTLFKDMLTSDSLCVDVDGKVRRRVVSCIIADGVLGFTCDVADEIDVPIFCVRTISSCCLWIFFCLPELIESGEYPFKDDNLDEPIKSVPGTETFLRRRDLPEFCRSGDLTDPNIQLFKTEGQENSRAYGLILNTFEELDQPILNQMRTICPNLYPIGPIHAHLKKKQTTLRSSSNSLWAEDRTCIDWLDDQLPSSVIYVSFGSIATMTNDQLIEFWYGLVNSKQNFLWVIRPNSIGGEEWRSKMPEDLVKETKERGYIVEWAPQEEVLAHPAVGGFWTHCGWNSILESVYEGKPMICWPYFFDQQVNSRFVEKVWGLGLDMKDTCDREIVEKMVKDLMVLRKQEFMGRANHMSKLAKNCLMEGGSSYSNFDRLVKDIKSLSNKVQSLLK